MAGSLRSRLAHATNRVLRPAHLKLVRAGSTDEYRTLGYHEIQIDHRTLRCEPEHPNFWRLYSRQEWEPETLAILRDVLRPESVYWDIGAWIGPTVITAALLCQTVCAFEPDPVAYRALIQNLTNNRLTNVRAFNLAVSTTNGIAPMRSFGTGLGDSMSSLLAGATAGEAWPVTTVTLDTLTSALSCPVPTVIKVDIEGGEFTLLPAIRPFLEQWRPVLYLSVHAPFLPAQEREAALATLAASLAGLTCEAYRDGAVTAGERFAVETLPRSFFREEFGSLLLTSEQRLSTRTRPERNTTAKKTGEVQS
jgi:FkbM family methyltransferase